MPTVGASFIQRYKCHIRRAALGPGIQFILPAHLIGSSSVTPILTSSSIALGMHFKTRNVSFSGSHMTYEQCSNTTMIVCLMFTLVTQRR